MKPVPSLILASGSIYRKQLLERLDIAFSVEAADIDETPLEGEPPEALVSRLAAAKAEAVARQHPEAAVFGLDQVAELDGRALGKPGSEDNARQQLAQLSGRTVWFRSGICLHLPGGKTDVRRSDIRVDFRDLDKAEIQRYVERDRPLDCAGSFRSETLGASLVRAIRSDDPTALMGLPLITVCAMLRSAGWQLP